MAEDGKSDVRKDRQCQTNSPPPLVGENKILALGPRTAHGWGCYLIIGHTIISNLVASEISVF